jgi:hypothetical protein
VPVTDHLVYAVSSLAEAVDDVERATGVRPAYGGAHVGLGTHNALLSFGECYLELIAPDPEQPEPERPRPFGIDDLGGPRLVTFAVRPAADETLDGLIARARADGYDPGDPIAMSRRAPDGTVLEWRLTFPRDDVDGLVPFLIDWGDTPQPSRTAPGGVRLVDVVASHPAPQRIAAARAALGIDDAVTAGDLAFHATVRGPAGDLRL